jgi:hypothetical protein
MSLKKLAALACAILLLAGFANAQTTSEIYGKAADKSGGGRTRRHRNAHELLPCIAAANRGHVGATGVYRFPALAIGTYSVKFELSGLHHHACVTGVRLDHRPERADQRRRSMSPVHAGSGRPVTGEAPLIDTAEQRRASPQLQPGSAAEHPLGARPLGDPPAVGRHRHGPREHRRQPCRASSPTSSPAARRRTQQKWNLDGIDITDMSATGASPVYYDFDAFEEMQITTGGADVTMQTAGVGVNLITKSGSDKFKGSGRYYVHRQEVPVDERD